MTTLEINIHVDRPNNLKYDTSLFEVYVLDYNDNYHRLPDEPSSEFEKEVRHIRARYKSLSKYNDAMITYNEWMEYLANKHGGGDILKKKIKAGLVEDYIPRKPRLKNTVTLKYLYKHNIVVSEVHDDFIDMDKLNEYLNEVYPDDDKELEVCVVRDKEAEKLSDEVGMVGRRITTTSFSRDSDYLDDYFSNRLVKGKKKKGKKKKDKKKYKEDKYLLTDVMNGYYDYDDSIEDSDNKTIMDYNGLLLDSGTTKEMEVYQRLNEIGWNSYKLMKRSKYSKRVASAFKPLKKGKKKKKGPSARDSYDDLIIDIVQDQGYDNFEEFEKDMLNMTAANVFK